MAAEPSRRQASMRRAPQAQGMVRPQHDRLHQAELDDAGGQGVEVGQVLADAQVHGAGGDGYLAQEITLLHCLKTTAARPARRATSTPGTGQVDAW